MLSILAKSLHIASRTDRNQTTWAAPDHWREANDRHRRAMRAEMGRDVPDRKWLEETRF